MTALKRTLRRASLVATALISTACQAAAADPKVDAVVARTKAVPGTYALYMWHHMSLPGQAPLQEWSAEFHSGDRHRVETPRDRVVADCRSGAGAVLSVVSGETRQGPDVGASACGIDTARQLVSSAWLGLVQTRWGEADRVRLVDEGYVRTYDISRAGVILRTTYAENRSGGATVLVAEAVDVLPELPERDIFSAASLARSAVPAVFRGAPKAAPAN